MEPEQFDFANILNMQQQIMLFGSILSQRGLQPYEALMYKVMCDKMREFYATMRFEDEDDDEFGANSEGYEP